MENKEEKLKICQLGMKRIPSREGGIEVVVEELSKRMIEAGNEVTCLNRSGHHVSGKKFDSSKCKEYNGIKLVTIPTINIKGLAAMSASFFGALYAAFGRFDVVHFHAEGPCAMLWIPKLFKKRCVATIHGLDHQRAKWGKFASWYIMLGEKVAVKYADEIIVLSQGVQNYFKKTYNRDTKFIPNGVDKPKMKKAEMINTQFGLEKDSYFLYLGRLVPEKGIKYLIEAFQSVTTNKKLVIAGGASDTDEFANELMAKAKKDSRIIFIGFVQGQILEELYSNAYVYILPSDLEGMPLSLLEAMSYGNCCLVSDIEECANVVEDNAVIFEKANVQKLKESIQYLCEDLSKVESMKSKASDYICNKYNWDDVSTQTMKLYVKQKENENV